MSILSQILSAYSPLFRTYAATHSDVGFKGTEQKIPRLNHHKGSVSEGSFTKVLYAKDTEAPLIF